MSKQLIERVLKLADNLDQKKQIKAANQIERLLKKAQFEEETLGNLKEQIQEISDKYTANQISGKQYFDQLVSLLQIHKVKEDYLSSVQKILEEIDNRYYIAADNLKNFILQS